MAVCNLFCNTDELKNTGTFLTFSQYLEDLTHHNSDGVSYNIRPSSFFALDLDFSNDGQICEKLMTDVENYCACLKNENKWNPEYFYHMLWQTLKLYVKKYNDLTNTLYGYKGDITIQSFNDINGMGYSEIYCHIPYTSKRQIWGIDTSLDFEDSVDTSITSGDHLEGYPNKTIEGGRKNYTLNQCVLTKTNESEETYSFNTIVVFYNVFSGADTLLYENIPMGIFFTGKIENGLMSNPVHITPNSENVFYSGSSYGLKICSRFATNNTSDILSTTEISYDDLSLVLEQISESQILMNQIVSKCDRYIAEKDDSYSMFKNSRTNVPYIKDVKVIRDGQVITEPHWFVNGRDLGYSIYDNE